MKTRTLTWCAAALLGATIAGPAQADTWALLVGVSKYESPSIKSLTYPAVDATSLSEALIDPQLGGQQADHIKLLVDGQATKANITGAVDAFLKSGVKKGDQVIVFLAGHGVTKGVGLDARSYFLPTDTKGVTVPALESSALDLKILSRQLSQLPASQFVVFVDACREDPTPGRGIKGNTLSNVMSRNVTVVPQDPSARSATYFACAVGQRAFEDERFKHGVFTHFILEGVRKAAVPDPQGNVDLSRLSTFVNAEVSKWARETSQSGAFEVEQTPELIAAEQLQGPIIFMQVKRPVMGEPVQPQAPRVTVGTLPEGAQVTINGKRLGAGTVSDRVPRAGEYTIRVEAPGYAPAERAVRLQDGYEHQLLVQLEPGGAKVESSLHKGQAAEARGEHATAASEYDAAIAADPASPAGYERRSSLYQRQGKSLDSLRVLLRMLKETPKSAHGYALLSRAYSNYALKEQDLKKRAEAGNEKSDSGGGSVLDKIKNPFGKKPKKPSGQDKDGSTDKRPAGAFREPENAETAAALGLKAAELAEALDEQSAEAQVARGFALMASDYSGDGKQNVLDALDQGRTLRSDDAETHWAAGYGRRYYAAFAKGKAGNERQVRDAIAAQEQALKLRPNYYEAHLELAYCYHLLGDRSQARRHYEQANACRADARDADEVAGANVALAALYGEEAKSTKGQESKQLDAASKGYEEDATAISPNLDRAVGILVRHGLGGRLQGFLPTNAAGVLDRMRSRIGLPSFPGVPGLPGLPIPGVGRIRL